MLLVAVLLGSAVCLTSAVVVLRPAQDVGGEADVIVVLAGAEQERLALGLQLWRDGRAPVLALSSVPTDGDARRTADLCERPPPRLLCFTPDPASTRGEARVFGDLAERRGWDSMLVVTSESHISRARTLFGRCSPGPVLVVGAEEDGGWRHLAERRGREVLALLWAHVDRRC